MADKLNRRSLLKIGAVAVAAAGTAGIASAQGHRFFTPEEFAIVDEYSDIIIPTDEKSPGARAAKVADYIDGRLADAFENETRITFRENLKLVDAVSQKMNQTAFMQATPQQRTAVVLEMAKNEKKPVTPEEKFFGELKEFTTRGYYSSKIGIHTDMDYKGNVVQGGDYAGVLPVGPALGSNPSPSK